MINFRHNVNNVLDSPPLSSDKPYTDPGGKLSFPLFFPILWLSPSFKQTFMFNLIVFGFTVSLK